MASEKKRFLSAVIASVVSLAAAMVYSLAASRVTLLYLDKESFGLVSLIAQIVTYLAILDLGMTTAFTRILIDHNRGDEKAYARAIRTARLIFAGLGVVGMLAAFVIALAGRSFFEIPDSLAGPFRNILLVQGVILLLGFLMKPFSAPLVANGRQDLVGWVSTLSLITNTIVMWIAFACGVGIYSMLIGLVVASGISFLSIYLASRRYAPAAKMKTRFDRAIFLEIFSFARDTVLWQIGGSCMYVLPTLLVSTVYGLIIVADLSGGMKMILLLISVATRIPDMAVAPLAIQASAGNRDRAQKNLMRVCELSGACGILAAIFLVAANIFFVDWWMLGEIHWSFQANLSASLWVALLPFFRVFYGFAVIGKHMEIIRWAPIWQCSLLALIFFLTRNLLGPFAIIFALPVAEVIVGVTVMLRMRKRAGLGIRPAAAIAMRQVPVCLVAIAVSVFVFGKTKALSLPPFEQFALASTAAAIIGLCALPLLLTPTTRREIFGALRSKIGPKIV